MVHRNAPEGVYYVTEDVSVRLKAGIMGVSAGTQVKLIKDNGEMLQVTDGTTQFDIKKSQVTNDLDEASTILKRTRALDAASDAARAEQEAAIAKQQRGPVGVSEVASAGAADAGGDPPALIV